MRNNNKPSSYRYKNKNSKKNKDKRNEHKFGKHKLNQDIQPKESVKVKIMQVFLPYLGLSILTILLLGALRWTLDIYLDILPLKQGYWNFGIPFFVSVLIVSVWMRPRFSFLTLKWSKSNSSSYFFITMILALVVPLIISQNYIAKASYEVVAVESLDSIRDYPRQKYFSIDNYELLKSDHVSYIDSGVVSSSYDSDLNVYYYFATPFSGTDSIWLGSYYYTAFDNRAAQSKQDREYSAFIDDSQNKYEAQSFSNISYFKKLKSSNESNGYLHAITKAGKPQTSSPLVLVPESGPFVDSLYRDLVWGLGSFMTGIGLCLLLILVASIDNTKWQYFQKKEPTNKRDIFKQFSNLFSFKEKLPATAALMLSLVIAFIITVVMGMDVFWPLTSQIIDVGGLSKDTIQSGQYWRLLTSLFVHVGIISLAFNLATLLLAGYLLERILGITYFVLAFFLCGIFSNILSLWYFDSENIAGVYNALLGLFGITIALIGYKIYDKEQRQWYGAITIVFLSISIVSMLATFIHRLDYIGYHLLTLCVGIGIGLLIIAIQRPTLIANAKRHKR